MDVYLFTGVFLAWQIIYYLSSKLIHIILTHPRAISLIPDVKTRATLRVQAPAYLTSTIHALYVAPRGLQHILHLLNAPHSIQIQRPLKPIPDAWSHYAAETDRVLWTNLVLAGYLGADLLHVIRLYPKIGKRDTIIHHLAFCGCAIVAGIYELYPFMFGWLAIGEASTPFLNIRWALIRTGYTHGSLFRWVEMGFGIMFVITRLFIYAGGLTYHLSTVLRYPPMAPPWSVMITTSFVVSGFILNLVWLRGIIRLATGATRREHQVRATDKQ